MNLNFIYSIVFFFIVQNLFAQTDFTKHIIIDDQGTTREPRCVFTADLDGDGDLDVLSASDWDNKIAWHENFDGLGHFGVQKVIEDNADQANIVLAADIDNDGDMDVVSGSEGDDIVAWYENMDGEGDFGEKQTISSNVGFVKSIDIKDIDNDGDMDVITASSWDDEISWFENVDGEGSFGAKQIISADGIAYSVFSTDLDGDGDNDVIAAFNGDNKISWYENIDGQGSFGGPQSISENAIDVFTIYSADFDNDGDMDVVAILGNEIAWYENTNGLGIFGTEQVIVSDFYYAKSVHADDVDNDGDIDILAASYSLQKISWFENLNSQGSFGSENIITSLTEGAEDVYTGDMNGDGKIDVLSASSYDNKVAWYENLDGLGSFGPQIEISRNQDSFLTTDIMPADMDGDDLKDLVASDRWSNSISWYKNIDGNGNFGPQQIIYNDADQVEQISVCDIDGDLDMDVVYVSYEDNEIGWLENVDGIGNFQTHIISQQFVISLTVYTSDLDDDGDIDIISGSSNNSKRVVWFENIDGNGTFGTERNISDILHGIRAVYVKDIDGDGDMDVISSSSTDRKLGWYENLDGQGNFGPPNTISLDSSTWFIESEDIDNDGDMDILASSFDHDTLLWYENIDGQGDFSIVNTISSEHEDLTSAQIMDIDNDGDKDILVTSLNDGKIAWYENIDGQGVFGSQQIVDTQNLAQAIHAADIDGDGVLDIIAGAGGKISWYENLSVLSVIENNVSKFAIYPNPIESVFNIKSDTSITTIEIFNELGQIVFSSDNSDGIKTININHIESGLYFIKAQDLNGVVLSKKILKE